MYIHQNKLILTSLSPPPLPLRINVSNARLGKIRLWICCMQMSKIPTTPLLCPLLDSTLVSCTVYCLASRPNQSLWDYRAVCLLICRVTSGPPGGLVLSSFLFAMYMSDFKYNSISCHLQKY